MKVTYHNKFGIEDDGTFVDFREEDQYQLKELCFQFRKKQMSVKEILLVLPTVEVWNPTIGSSYEIEGGKILDVESDKPFNEYRYLPEKEEVKLSPERIKEIQDGIDFIRGKDVKPEQESCTICGFKLVAIRGQHPKSEPRMVCAQCSYEKLEQIRSITERNYGQAYKS